MVFLLRAGFWIAVVAFFLPGNPAADALVGGARDAAQTAARTTQSAPYAQVASICAGDPKLCMAGLDAVDSMQSAAIAGLDALATVLDSETARSAN